MLLGPPFAPRSTILLDGELEQRGEHVAAERRQLEAGRALGCDRSAREQVLGCIARDASALPIGAAGETEQHHDTDFAIAFSQLRAKPPIGHQ
jgi:hypothetical protein